MNENNENTLLNGETSAEKPKQQFQLQHLYCKEQECEVAHAPTIYLAKPSKDKKDKKDEEERNRIPTTQLEMSVNHALLSGNRFEVVLRLRITAKLGQQTAYQVKLEQAGLFHIEGYTEEERQLILNVHAAQLLYPYARQTVSNLTQAAGFPPLQLTPMSFEGMYRQQQAQRGSPGQSETSGATAEVKERIELASA